MKRVLSRIVMGSRSDGLVPWRSCCPSVDSACPWCWSPAAGGISNTGRQSSGRQPKRDANRERQIQEKSRELKSDDDSQWAKTLLTACIEAVADPVVYSDGRSQRCCRKGQEVYWSRIRRTCFASRGEHLISYVQYQNRNSSFRFIHVHIFARLSWRNSRAGWPAKQWCSRTRSWNCSQVRSTRLVRTIRARPSTRPAHFSLRPPLTHTPVRADVLRAVPRSRRQVPGGGPPRVHGRLRAARAAGAHRAELPRRPRRGSGLDRRHGHHGQQRRCSAHPRGPCVADAPAACGRWAGRSTDIRIMA